VSEAAEGSDRDKRAPAPFPASVLQQPEPARQPGAAAVRTGRLLPDQIEAALHVLMAAERGRLADLFGAIEEDGLVLRVIGALDRQEEYRVLEWVCRSDEYPPLSEIAPAAFVEECEIYEQFEVRLKGGKTLNRIVAPPHIEPAGWRPGWPRHREAKPAHTPHYVEGEAFEFPVGPVRGVGQESLFLGLVTSGEEVLDLRLLQWHKHRGIERRLEGLRPGRALFLAERAEGLSAVGNGLAFCRAVEHALGATPGVAVECTRAVALELERIYNHAAAIAALAQTTGLSVGQAQAEIALEQLLRLNAAVAGHRYLFGLLAIGGTRRQLDREGIAALLGPAVDDLRRVIDALGSTNSFADRLEATGAVSGEAAARLGLVGPVARASGCDVDARRDHPSGPLGRLGVQVPVRSGGDVLARMDIMTEEITESVRLIYDLLSAGTGTGTGTASTNSHVAGHGLGWSESARGEALAWVSLDTDGTIARARLRPASVRNWRAFDDAARARNVFTDIPIIEASFWLTVAGFAR
jgi:Ni,Fe-hydrogenase III large subunit